eukprot:scaffold140011_cov127-Phaeocystis_antarctica.AAC.1
MPSRSLSRTGCVIASPPTSSHAVFEGRIMRPITDGVSSRQCKSSEQSRARRERESGNSTAWMTLEGLTKHFSSDNW